MNLGDLDKDMEKIDGNQKMINRVQHCIDEGHECNDWEMEFLNSIMDWLMQGRPLSDRQQTALEKIEYLVVEGRESYWAEFGRGH